MPHTLYVVGFLFATDEDKVVLIRKNRPEWQKGLLNGVGGHVEEHELPFNAIKREFFEETGLSSDQERIHWEIYTIIHGDGYTLFVYKAFAPVKVLNKVKSTTDEQVSVEPIEALCSSGPFRQDGRISNLAWLLPLALDPNAPTLANATYIKEPPMRKAA